jgi:3-(3-hydroxy-phenyl)propionate hydroxylase
VLAELRRDRPIGVHGHPQANLFDQPDLERLLRANLARHPLVTLRGGVELTALQETGGGVRVTLREGATLSEVRAQIVLGCDGAKSTVRDLIGSTLRDLRFTERWCVVDARCTAELDAWDGVHQVCDPRRAATYMRIGPDRYRWEFRLAAGESPQSLDLDRLLAPWTRGTPVEVLRSVEYTFKARLADRWQRGRVFLLGDAAHLTPPFIGQGLGAGLRDAANLAWKVAAVLTGGADFRLAATYQPERRPQARQLIQAAVAVGWAMTAGRDTTAVVRRGILAAAGRVPGFNTAAMATIAPRIRRGPLVGSRRGLPGTLVPQPWVTVDGRRQRLDDVLGDGFAILCRRAPDAESLALARRLGARIVRLPSVRDDGVLAGWLRRGHARTVLIRPDRVVLAAGRSGADLAAASRALTAMWQ